MTAPREKPVTVSDLVFALAAASSILTDPDHSTENQLDRIDRVSDSAGMSPTASRETVAVLASVFVNFALAAKRG